jgi:hypothetical protein
VMKQGGEVYWKCVFLTCEVSIDIGIAKHKIQQGLYLHLKWYYPFPSHLHVPLGLHHKYMTTLKRWGGDVCR